MQMVRKFPRKVSRQFKNYWSNFPNANHSTEKPRRKSNGTEIPSQKCSEILVPFARLSFLWKIPETTVPPATRNFRISPPPPPSIPWGFLILIPRLLEREWDLYNEEWPYRGILVYNTCLISISNSVSDGRLQINQFWILKAHSAINSANEYEPDVLNTFRATRV